MKINLGCGNRLLEGYINIDIYAPSHKTKEQFLQADALEIDSYFLADSVDEVYSSHFFEHLTHFEVTDLLYRIFNILKPGGKLIIRVPDFIGLITDYAKRQSKGDFSDTDILHLKVFSTEKETLHKTVWYKEIGQYYLVREGLFDVMSARWPSLGEIEFTAVKRGK